MNSLAKIEKCKEEQEIPMQMASYDIWKTKYQLRNKAGDEIDKSIDDMFLRVATTLSDVELEPDRKKVCEEFIWALNNGAIPAGRVNSNVGAKSHKPATSAINCTVSPTILDSMDDILKKNHLAGLTLKAGCGIGYEFSTLRPKGAYVGGAGANTSGPLSFMDIYDKMCFTVSSAGGRRGAQMATFDIHHPDIMEFIKAKRENGRLRQFNLSLLITEDFIEAVKSDKEWCLSFPITEKELQEDKIEINDRKQIVFREFPVNDGYLTDDIGQVACRIHKIIKARVIWDMIMKSTYDFAEPGFILIDKVNEMNNNWFCENIRATNPCGEQPLPPYGSCLLGSVNLTKFISEPFSSKAAFDFPKYVKVVRIFTRLLDNVVEINGLPLAEQRQELQRKRRHGMGILGLGSAMTMLRIKYGSKESVEFTEKVNKVLAITGWEESINLAKLKGAAPIMDETFVITQEMLHKRPEMIKDGIKLGDKVKGKVLHARYSRYMQKIGIENKEIVSQIEKYGARFTHHSSIAPTGTIALSIANNASNGIEPSFAHQYARNIITEGRNTKKKVDVFSYELLAYRHLINSNAKAFSEDSENKLPEYFISADEITPKEHVDVQAAAQKWIDSSISKTANVPTEFPFNEFKEIYMYAVEKGLKGCTTFRFNPQTFQGVLVKEVDLENTTYTFTLEDGSTVNARGNETIKYEGQEHSAANLFDALKEGTYGSVN
jgi:ribonucleoside-diphosphate reductase alpha chain